MIDKKTYFNIVDSILCKENIVDSLKLKINDNTLLPIKRIFKTINTELIKINKIFPNFERCSSKILIELFNNRITNAMQQLNEWINNTKNKLEEIDKEINFNSTEIEVYFSFTELKDNIKKIF